MQSYTRSLTLTAALLAATILALLITAAPQETKTPPPRPVVDATPRLVVDTKAREAEAGPPVAPITFADPDGQELILEELSVRTAIHGMLSLTELELRFRNPQERRIEGRFTCTLPQNAAISRFAKDVNGQLMEGEVVERLRANQVYESYLHQMRDPALLEQDQGNRFSARIFPIEAKAPVHLVVSWTQMLPLKDGARTYTLPLRGIDKVKKLTFKAFVTPVPGAGSQGKMTTSTAQVTSFEETDWTPDRDIVLTWADTDNAPRILKAGDFYLAALRPNVQTANRQPPTANWSLYVDTSASSAEGAPHRIRAIEALLRGFPANTRVQLVAFDQDIVPLASGTASELAGRAGALLRERLFLGGTDVGALLRDVTRVLREEPSRGIVLASDLVPTVGTVAPHELKSTIDALPARGTIHALILGSREDAPTAKAITGGRGRIVRVPFTDSLASRAREAAEELRRPLGGTVDIADASAEWIYPSHFDDVQPGDEIIALGKLKPGREPNIGSASALESKTFAPLLEREAYRAYLEYLAQREANEPSEAVRRALATEQVRISTEQRVVIPRTTMLVLENEWEYQRWGLDRRALAAILTIEAGGIGRIDRRNEQWAGRPVPPMPVPMPRPERRERAMAEAPKAVSAPANLPPSSLPPVEVQASAADFAEETEALPVAQGVEGGVEGGVVGGVAGGVVGGVVNSTDALSVPAPPPPMRVGAPRPAPVPEPVPERKRATVDWTRRRTPSRDEVAKLERQLRDDPRDRELYNQLGETLAALGEWSDLRALALRWQPYDPENPQVYELLGMAGTELGRETEAARAFASLIEIAPNKPELLQRAGLLLLRTHRAALAEAPLRRALEMRPDRANAYRHLALLLWRDGRIEEAARVLETATRQDFPGWYGGVQRVVREELGYVYRAWLKKDPSMRRDIEQRAREHDVDLDRLDAMRITLAWETDANDVDLHVVDPAGEEVYYSNKESDSGLQLYEDITQGLGPEVVRARRTARGTYHVGVRYFAAGPMGISRGVVIVMHDDAVDIHPFRLAKGGEEIRYVAAIKTE